jgi:uncharacterized Zn finger protein
VRSEVAVVRERERERAWERQREPSERKWRAQKPDVPALGGGGGLQQVVCVRERVSETGRAK